MRQNTTKKETFFSLFFILFIIASYDLFELAGASILNLLGGDNAVQPYAADTIACLLMVLFYGTLFYLRFSSKNEFHKRKASLFTLSGISLHTLLNATVITLGIGGFSYLWLSFTEHFLSGIQIISESSMRFQEYGDSLGLEPYPIIFLSFVTIGPLVEEIMFRGLIFHEAERIKGGLFPVLLSGILFGLFHMEFVQIVYTIVMGLVFGLVYRATRSFPLICYMHILNNLLATPPPALEQNFYFEAITAIQVISLIPAMILLYFVYLPRSHPRVIGEQK